MPLIINRKATGYYRVNYDQDNWDRHENCTVGMFDPIHCRIVETLLTDHTLIHPFNRAALVCDSVALAGSGHLAPATRDRLLQ